MLESRVGDVHLDVLRYALHAVTLEEGVLVKGEQGKRYLREGGGEGREEDGQGGEGEGMRGGRGDG